MALFLTRGGKAFWGRIGVAVILCAALLGFAGCAAEDSINLTGAGATFPYPLYSKWFDEYSRSNPQTLINYQSIGSGGGIQQLKAGTVDFGASDAPLSDKEMADMPGEVVHIPTVAGAVAVTYNLPGVEKGLQLTPEALADVFLGKITNWNDSRIASANPDTVLPDLAVVVGHRADGSGTTYIFTQYLAAVSEEWEAEVGAGKSVEWPAGIGGKGNEGVTAIVKQTPGGIGYVELAYAEQNSLSYAAIQNQTGQFVEPSTDSTTAAAAGAVEEMKKDVRVSLVNSAGEGAYPIAGFTYILAYRQQQDKAKGEALVKLLRWMNHEGQRDAASLLYAPLPAAVVELNDTAIKSITYEGSSLLVTE